MDVHPLCLPPAVGVQRCAGDRRFHATVLVLHQQRAVSGRGVGRAVAEPVGVLPQGDPVPVVLQHVPVDVDLVRAGFDPWFAAGLGQVDRRVREVVAALGGLAALDPVVPPDRVVPDDRVVADLVDQRGAVVLLDQVVLDAEVVVVGVRPQPGSAVVVHPVAAYLGAVDGPELDATGAAAAGLAPLPVAGVVADDLVPLDHQVADGVAGLVRVHSVLAVVAQAVGADLLAGAGHQPGAVVVLDRGVLDHPPVGHVVVDHALVGRCDEALHGQEADGDVTGGAAERVRVLPPAVENRARRTDVAVPLLGHDLGVALRFEPMGARSQPERGARGVGPRLLGQVADHVGVDRHRARRRLGGSGPGLGAHPGRG